jgi:threonine/homoserine/homoserine lactone efflux protein
MDLAPFVQGLIIGVAVAAPVGPMSVLCMRRTLAGGFAVGLLSGFGIASADALYGSVAAFGITVVSDLLVGQQALLRWVGGAFLLYLGVRTLRSRPADRPAQAERGGLVGTYLSTLGLTLTNPTTILSFAAIFAGLGVGAAGSGRLAPALVVAGVFLGSALWWLALSGGISALRARLTPATLRWANVASGLVIGGFGVAALLAAVQASGLL